MRIAHMYLCLSQTTTMTISKTMTGNSLAVHDQTWASLSGTLSICLCCVFFSAVFSYNEQIFDKLAREQENASNRLEVCVLQTDI